MWHSNDKYDGDTFDCRRLHNQYAPTVPVSTSHFVRYSLAP